MEVLPVSMLPAICEPPAGSGVGTMARKPVIALAVSTSPYAVFIHYIIELAKLKNSTYTCVANVHMLIEGYRDPHFASMVNHADVVAPDGMPLTWMLKLLHGIKQDRVAGMFLTRDLLAEAEKSELPVFFYGSTEDVLQSAVDYCHAHHPDLRVAGAVSPPFRTLTPEEEHRYATQINLSGARIVFVALGCPRQEQWMARMQGKIAAAMIGVGAALAVLVGKRKMAPMWLQKSGLEWLFRLCLEPKRLFRRYAVTNSIFFLIAAKELIRVKLLKKAPGFCDGTIP